MLLLNICFMVILAANSITECYSLKFSQNISEGEVNGKMIKFCEYKLLKMLPKSNVQDAEACLSCSCRKKGLTCKHISNKPGCERNPGGQFPQNPFDSSWKSFVDKLIDSKYVGKYRVLLGKSQVVAGSITFIKLLVIDRLCDLEIFTSWQQTSQILKDSCDIGKQESKPEPPINIFPYKLTLKPLKPTQRPGLPYPRDPRWPDIRLLKEKVNTSG